MNVSQTMETEEDLLTCLQIKMFHPQQSSKDVYRLIPLGSRSRHSADDPLRLGRDGQTSSYILQDLKVSRKQLSLQAYRTPHNPDLLFTIQNLSQRSRLTVSNKTLGYLEKMDLPQNALVEFGEYVMVITREPGEAKATFEVEFQVLLMPPSREVSTFVERTKPVMETGLCSNGFAVEMKWNGPLETDETLPCFS
ncbi:TRAF-interacting protein with FHA domain-containing protein A [Gouania willdenowi]|uniref:TRAF-interacting protein with FHA domain-containing protein A n=1 Tax=Gouania willdenowi TaxID=441366 RepID=A0A8C5HMA3_GOUWI|nr:TRAF-interacting protein with FHA domain-containing protein A [Gouania willdenowi]